MRFSLEFRVESLLFLAFMATVPIYSPNMVMFTKGLPYSESFMPCFIYTYLGLVTLGGIGLSIYSLHQTKSRVFNTRVIYTAALSYLAGYILFVLIGAVPYLGNIPLTVVAAALLAFGTVELGVVWGVYLATFYDLKHALIWIGIMVGVSSVVQLLLSSVAFQVGAAVFFVLLIAGVAPLCYLAQKGNFGLADVLDSEGTLVDLGTLETPGTLESQGAVGPFNSRTLGAPSVFSAYFINLRSMAKVIIVPFIGLMVFAYVMGVRKYILFDLVYVEILGGMVGAFLAVSICFVKRAKPLLPFIYQVAMPIFALVILVLSAMPFGGTLVWMHTCLSYIFFGAIGVFSMASLCAMAHAKEFNPILIYGSTTAAFSLASAFGLVCGTLPLFFAESGEAMLNLIEACYFAFLLAYPLVAGWKKIRSYDADVSVGADFEYSMRSGVFLDPQRLDSAAHRLSKDDQETPNVADRCAKVAENCKLSPRETEIFGYLGRGHGIVFIAETLVISESTVRTHVKNIYKKIGVSSREELLQLVDQDS